MGYGESISMKGWIKLHRSLLEWEWYDDTNTVRLFLHLLLKANHKDKKYKGQLIQRGQLVTGRSLLSEQTGLSEQQIRTCLNKLKSTNEITIKSTSKGTLVTLANYGLYQDGGSEPTSTSTSNQTNEQPATNQQSTTNKNVKNENKQDTCTSIDARDPVPYQKIVDQYNGVLVELPAVAILNASRKQLIKSRWNQKEEFQSVEFWGQFFNYVSQSDFLMGRAEPRPGSSKPWQATFDWIMKQANFVKIYEGNYENQ